MTACSVKGCERKHHARGLCVTHYYHFRSSDEWTPAQFRQIQEPDGLGVCVCPTSWPNPKCCTTCGFPCVHRMAPHIRDLALERMPSLRNQVIAGRHHKGAA